MKKFNKTVGNIGEDIACELLKKKKYKIIVRNYVSDKGEIDIIAQKKGTTVFIEVKTRRNDSFGSPSEAVDYRKKRHIIETAERYIWENELSTDFRFDVIEVFGFFDGITFNFERAEHIENAFGVDY